MIKLLFIVGTRPEIIKIAPIVLEMRKQKKYEIIICNTEQQKELSNQTLTFFGIQPDYSLNIMSSNQRLSNTQAKILEALNKVYENNKIDATIVQGDTMSAFCGALAGFYFKTPIFHIEAGLRSYNNFEPYPEEAIRRMISCIANLHFAPTTKAYDALIKEGVFKNKIFITGNTVIDALHCLSNNTLSIAKEELSKKNINLTDNIVLITTHRRENHGSRLNNIIYAIKSLAEEFTNYTFITPVHPNPNVKQIFYSKLSNICNVNLVEPLSYPELVLIMKNAKLILTDSGGIQEEAPTFHTPILVLRHKTERMEGIESGIAKLVGTDTDKIIKESKKILNDANFKQTLLNLTNPYGDGQACKRIIRHIEDYFYDKIN